MLAQLFHADEACGTATVGSSEAILLGGLAMKRRWQARARAGNLPRIKTLYPTLGSFACALAWHLALSA